MTEYGLTIRGEPDDIVVEGLLGDRPELQRGSETTLRLDLQRRPLHPNQIAETGGQYAGEGGFQWSGPPIGSGGQYSAESGYQWSGEHDTPQTGVGAQWSGAGISRTVPELTERFAALMDYLEVADAATYGVDRRGIPWYHDHVDSDDPVDSLLIGIVFGDAFSLPDVWALVVGGSVETRLLADSATVELEVVVVATMDEQPDRSAVETDLAEPL